MPFERANRFDPLPRARDLHDAALHAPLPKVELLSAVHPGRGTEIASGADAAGKPPHARASGRSASQIDSSGGVEMCNCKVHHHQAVEMCK